MADLVKIYQLPKALINTTHPRILLDGHTDVFLGIYSDRGTHGVWRIGINLEQAIQHLRSHCGLRVQDCTFRDHYQDVLNGKHEDKLVWTAESGILHPTGHIGENKDGKICHCDSFQLAWHGHDIGCPFV